MDILDAPADAAATADRASRYRRRFCNPAPAGQRKTSRPDVLRANSDSTRRCRPQSTESQLPKRFAGCVSALFPSRTLEHPEVSYLSSITDTGEKSKVPENYSPPSTPRAQRDPRRFNSLFSACSAISAVNALTTFA